jgi:hypothetical protein
VGDLVVVDPRDGRTRRDGRVGRVEGEILDAYRHGFALRPGGGREERQGHQREGGQPQYRLSHGVLLLSSVPFSRFVRYRQRRGDERQQIKWFASAAALTLVWITVFGQYSRGLPEAIVALSFLLITPSIPIATGIAILRYRLYDIDLLINRTLVYGLLTATLAALYFGAIVLLQRVFVALTGEKSTLAVVASTLVIAALFNPLRRRIQRFIDRRFYRRKYDARKTLEGFSAKLRDQTDLEALNGELMTVVRETMQPEHASLWLRPDTPLKGKRAN